MKRVFLFVILIFSYPAWAGFSVNGVTDPASVNGVTEPASVNGVESDYGPVVYCASCPDSDNGGDQVCEVPDGSSDGLCGWTITESGGSTGDVNMAASCDNSPALGCTNIAMTYCMAIVKTDANSGNAYATYNLTDATNIKLQFYVKLVSEGLGDDSDTTLLMIQDSSTGSGSVYFGWTQDEYGDFYIAMGYHEGGDWAAVWDKSTSTISTDTWYGIRVEILNPSGTGNDSIQWWIDFDNDGTFTDQGTYSSLSLDVPTNQLRFGLKSESRIINYQITGIKVDNDTMPSGCVK